MANLEESVGSVVGPMIPNAAGYEAGNDEEGTGPNITEEQDFSKELDNATKDIDKTIASTFNEMTEAMKDYVLSDSYGPTPYLESVLNMKLQNMLDDKMEERHSAKVQRAQSAYVNKELARMKNTIINSIPYMADDKSKVREARNAYVQFEKEWRKAYKKLSPDEKKAFDETKNVLMNYIADESEILKKQFKSSSEIMKESEDLIMNPDDSELMVDTDEVDEAAKINDDIKDIIDELNRKGYTTKYSSSGHPNLRKKSDGNRDGVKYGKLYTDARIMFAHDYKFPEAPKHWNMCSVDGCSYLDVDERYYKDTDGTPDEAWAKWKKDYMGTLKTWVDNLDTRADADNGRADKHGVDEAVPTKNVAESTSDDIDKTWNSMVDDYWLYGE